MNQTAEHEYIAQDISYDPQQIKTLIKNAKCKKLEGNIYIYIKKTPTDNKKYITLTHHDKTSQNIVKRFKKTQIQHSGA